MLCARLAGNFLLPDCRTCLVGYALASKHFDDCPSHDVKAEHDAPESRCSASRVTFSAIVKSSRPLIWAQPVRPGLRAPAHFCLAQGDQAALIEKRRTRVHAGALAKQVNHQHRLHIHPKRKSGPFWTACVGRTAFLSCVTVRVLPRASITGGRRTSWQPGRSAFGALPLDKVQVMRNLNSGSSD